MHILLLACVWACVFLVGCSLLIIAASALRALRTGKAPVRPSLMVAGPVIFGVLAAFVLGDPVTGAILACALTLALALLAVVASGLRGLWVA